MSEGGSALNLPTFEQLSSCQNLLIAGMGGGYDICCGLPIYFELQKRGCRVHLANFSFSDIENSPGGIRLSRTLVGVCADQMNFSVYFPELYLSQWFQQARQEAVTIWCFQKTGTLPLLKNYQKLVEHLFIDGILLVDGGVDSLMQGDETRMGTVVEDATSLYVVNALDQVPVRQLAAVGFGAEQDVAYAQVLENIAALTRAGAFRGACALTPQMESYRLFRDAVLHIQAQPFQDPSVINSSIISAVDGNFGDFHLTEKTRGSRLWISPLMTLYWFFDLPGVAERCRFLPELAGSETFFEALQAVMKSIAGKPQRKGTNIPL